ncbi:unnamed protein product [Fusarium langsethiae]|nr:unnamed protein product [Fusarium langsethiae]GKU14890.1 unnamed protein product [Fusarium langsethiae]
MSTTQRVTGWIRGLPNDFTNSPVSPPAEEEAPASQNQSHKRRKVQEPSPPATVADMDDPETPTNKRQRLTLVTDTELTPRPLYEPLSDPRKAPSLSGSNTSSQSRSTSPLKRQFLELRLDETGVETRALSVDTLKALPNEDAASLLRIMRRIGTCKGFLPENKREEILQGHGIGDSDLDDWDSAFKDSRAFDDLPGRIPSSGEIRLVCEWTTDCIDFKHEEAGWNDEVHFRLLQAIFREPGEKGGGLFNIATSNTARPHKNWLPRSAGSKLVDFCVYADTAYIDATSFKTHEAFCRTTLTKSVNQTDFQRLQMRPIVLSIETKAGNQSLDAAELQIGVWHAAQWAFLRSSLIAVKRAHPTRPATEQEVKAADEALASLRFIPAVIVQGHRWLFVLSTRQGHKTILWKEWQFGSTSTVVEAYQAVAGIRQLTAWAENVYLPWFEKEILAYYKASLG